VVDCMSVSRSPMEIPRAVVSGDNLKFIPTDLTTPCSVKHEIID